MQNGVLTNIYTRRSIRSYLDKPISDDVIQELLNAAVMAPSARNTQPWRFSLVTNRDEIKRLGQRVIELQKLLGRALQLGGKLTKIDPIFYDAPLLVFISGKSDYKYLRDDINLAVENMFLAAHSLGLGSCWIGFALPLDQDKEVRRQLGIPDDHEIVAPLIFGYPKKAKENIPEREVKILRWIR